MPCCLEHKFIDFKGDKVCLECGYRQGSGDGSPLPEDELDEVRAVLAGTDAGSLPNDYSTLRMAQERMAEIIMLRKMLIERMEEIRRWRVLSTPQNLGGSQLEELAKAAAARHAVGPPKSEWDD